MNRLSQPIDIIILFHIGGQFNILGFKNELVSPGIKKKFAVAPRDPKLKWRFIVIEGILDAANRACRCRNTNQSVWNSILLFLVVLDSYVESGVGVVVNGQREIRMILAIGITGRSIQTERPGQSTIRFLDIGECIPRTHVLGDYCVWI